MLKEQKIRSLVSRARKNPWQPILSRTAPRYRIPEIGDLYIETIDESLFERRFDNAMRQVVLFEKWSETSRDYSPRAKAAFGTILLICEKMNLADREIRSAVTQAESVGSSICVAECERRLGMLLWYQNRHRDAIGTYTSSLRRFEQEEDSRGVVINFINRGIAYWKLKKYDLALTDEEAAISLINETMPGFYVVAASLNIAAIYASRGDHEMALQQIENTQAMIKGLDGMSRARLILRWIRGLLLESEGKLKRAIEMLERVDRQMVLLDMDIERRVLLADTARIAKNPDKIIRIAERAVRLEDSPHVTTIVNKVIKEPSYENVLAWRDALDTYIPPFPAAA